MVITAERVETIAWSVQPNPKQPVAPESSKVLLETRDLNVYYGDNHAVKNINLKLYEKTVTAFIGPSGCGKSTFLRCLNRMNDTIPHARVTGEILIEGINVNDPAIDAVNLRRQVGMVFQKPNPFQKSIFDNVAYGPRIHGVKKKELPDIVEQSLRQVGLWDEVKDRLHTSALQLSGGQQQRLCIARTIAMRPRIILLDEPTSALDPISTARIEELIQELKKDYTIAIVTHNMQQAARISDYTAFFLMGELIEHNETHRLFTNPKRQETENYLTGRFG
ncbi:phosphate ABC transporter ATP-binding protein [Polycladomyces abyssicola]|jgi:phosphate transport system ATP-binding protein|uniref:Phosphate ABC transporter ATP-binding protein n=1 Tax=Polycladomyces abyssicola TaxID=1125966 RepID=A0A8D5UFJ7_9BACL|nr:phosphate ABC transporter ATP-binding protein PstB [Polycladomyces abyssicola]BCU81070.1 phosphate ABC transporter ATP-binding protein [Polycladomyces abyssicola]